MKKPSPEFPPPQPPSHRSRKTRELPNLSDCHCCNRHINYTNPKNRLKLMNSEWRIVLLCKSCYNLVETSQFCSYCLSRVTDLFYECKKCHHRIHRDCHVKYSFGSGDCGDDFGVCFDCWLPNLLESEYKLNRVVRSGSSKNKGAKKGGELAPSASLGMCDVQEKGKGLEDVVNEANAVLEQKVAVAVEAKENAFVKIITAKKAAEVAGGALGIVAVKKDGDQGGVVVDKDAELAIRLHRAMNSSPRISRNLCLLNTNCVDVPSNGLESQGGHGMNEFRQYGEKKVGFVQDKKCNGDIKDCRITYIREGHASASVKCREAPFCPLSAPHAVEHKGSPDSALNTSECVDCKEEPDCSVGVSTSMMCKEETDHSLSVSTGSKCKENPDCFSRVCSRKLSQFEKHKVAAHHCSKTYIRRHLHCTSKLGNGNFGNVNCEGSRASPNAS